MGDPLRRLRDWTAGFREQRPAVARASSVKGLPGYRSLRLAAFCGGIGVFLSLVGAFGVGELPLLRRTLYFAGTMMCGGLLGHLLNVWAGRQRWVRDRRWARFGVVALVAAPVMGCAVWASEHWLAPSTRQLSALPKYVMVAYGMSAAVTLLAFFVFPLQRAHDVAATPRLPRLNARLPVRLRGAEIWALQAEDHYLRVHTKLGDDLILMRLSDAILELDGIEGAQTHRSWWVAKVAVVEARRIDERAVLTLPNGVEAPVSRKFAPSLRRAGWF